MQPSHPAEIHEAFSQLPKYSPPTLPCTSVVSVTVYLVRHLCKNPIILFHSLQLFKGSPLTYGIKFTPLARHRRLSKIWDYFNSPGSSATYLVLYSLAILINKGIPEIFHAVSCFYDCVYLPFS